MYISTPKQQLYLLVCLLSESNTLDLGDESISRYYTGFVCIIYPPPVLLVQCINVCLHTKWLTCLNLDKLRSAHMPLTYFLNGGQVDLRNGAIPPRPVYVWNSTSSISVDGMPQPLL